MSFILDHIGLISFFLVFSLCYIVARGISINNKAMSDRKNSFWNRELEANSVRRKDISGLDYIVYPSHLPLDSLINIGRKDLADEFQTFSDKKIINLSGYSNTDLKLMYGPANLNDLSSYDENFTSFIRLLNNIGNALLDADTTDDTATRQFLEYSVSIGSDISATYINLAEIYIKHGEDDKLNDLINKAESLTSLSGPVIVTKLNNIKLQSK